MNRSYFIAILAIACAFAVHFFGEQLTDNIDLCLNGLLMRGFLPDPVIRFGVRMSLRSRLRDLENKIRNSSVNEYVSDFVSDLRARQLTAEHTDKANEQHYELDASFYHKTLGFYNKYSSTIYLTDNEREKKMYDGPPSVSLDVDLLDRSERDMLDLYIERAQLCVGMDCNLNVLDLGCGWGSFSLYYAAQCPSCHIISISNSQSQIDFIKARAQEMGLNNVSPRKVNVNELGNTKFGVKFDRVVSVEMFEHMKNYKQLLKDLKNIMECDGKLFVHMFVHKDKPYHFQEGWMAQYFFSGGTMPSHGMLDYFNEDFQSVSKWKVNGKHYSFTLESWLQKMDMNIEEIERIFANVYGEEKATITKWVNLWRTFFIACSELFGMNDGNEWFVGHYLLAPRCSGYGKRGKVDNSAKD